MHTPAAVRLQRAMRRRNAKRDAMEEVEESLREEHDAVRSLELCYADTDEDWRRLVARFEAYLCVRGIDEHGNLTLAEEGVRQFNSTSRASEVK